MGSVFAGLSSAEFRSVTKFATFVTSVSLQMLSELQHKKMEDWDHEKL